jgi:hypothetical protein
MIFSDGSGSAEADELFGIVSVIATPAALGGRCKVRHNWVCDGCDYQFKTLIRFTAAHA